MMLLKQPSRGHEVQPNRGPKLSPLELPRTHKPRLLETQTQESSRFPVNHCIHYIYKTIGSILPVNHCIHYTYINNSAELPVSNSTPYTYTTNCARCVINPRQSLNPQHPYKTSKTPPKLAKMPWQTPRLTKPTLNFTPSHLATTTRHTSTPDLNQNLQHPHKGSKPHSSKPAVHLEFW